jgi:hypothetical protein
MLLIITPTNYGLVPYGIASYSSYLASQIPPTPSPLPIPLVETLGDGILPAFVKVFWEFPSN